MSKRERFTAYVICDVRNGEMRIRKRNLCIGPYEIGFRLMLNLKIPDPITHQVAITIPPMHAFDVAMNSLDETTTFTPTSISHRYGLPAALVEQLQALAGEERAKLLAEVGLIQTEEEPIE